MQSYSGNSVIIKRERALSELRWYHEIFVLTSIEVGIFLFLSKERMIHMIQKPKGTADLLPEELKIWHYIEETARIILGDYQFEEMRTPMFESYDLFSRGVGDTSDIV